MFSWFMGTFIAIKITILICIWSNSFTCFLYSFIQTMITHNDHSNKMIDTSTSNRTDDHDERVNELHTIEVIEYCFWSFFFWCEFITSVYRYHFIFFFTSFDFIFLSRIFQEYFWFQQQKKFKVNINRVINFFLFELHRNK